MVWSADIRCSNFSQNQDMLATDCSTPDFSGKVGLNLVLGLF